MALFKPLMGDSTRLDAQEFHSGYAYLTTNDEKFYIDAIDDNGNQKRILINKEIAKTIIESNADTEISIWIGTTEEFNQLTEEEKMNCLAITTDDAETVSFENTSNKTTSITADSTDQQYASAKAIWSALQNISGYIKETDKSTVISNASTDDTIPSSKAVYDHTNNTVDAAKETILQTVEDRVLNVEKTTNKVTEITEEAKHTTYPSSKSVYDFVMNNASTDIETVDTIDENSTADTIPNTKAVHDFVVNHTPELPDTIPTVYTGTSEPDASTGKVGDLYVII